jgi:hypothetical protein
MKMGLPWARILGVLVLPSLLGGSSCAESLASTSLSVVAAQDVEEWVGVIQEAKSVLKEMESDPELVQRQEMQWIRERLVSILIQDSHAQEGLGKGGGRCAYGGWVSVRNAAGRCSVPPESKNRSCGSSFYCNPLLFGEGICVDASTAALRSTTFSRCEQRFVAGNSKDPYQYLETILKDPARVDALQKLLGQVQEICTAGTQSKTAMCARFLDKLSRLKKKLHSTTPVTKLEPSVVPAGAQQKESPSQGGLALRISNVEPTTKKQITPQKIKNESCTSCPPPTGVIAPVTQSSVKDVLNAYRTNARAVYARIKERYLKDQDKVSAECHPYSSFRQDEKEAFFVSLFNKEIRAFAEVTANRVPELSRTDALIRLREGLGWSESELNEWKKRAEALENVDLGLSSDVLGKMVNEKKDKRYVAVAGFQRDLIQKIKSALKTQASQKALSLRAGQLLKQNGIADCDFISEEAFVEAYQAAQNNSHQPEKANLLTVLDRSSGDIYQKNRDGSYVLTRDKQRVLKRPLPRRMLTVDLQQEKVLFHSEVSFGDGVVGKTTYESPKCSNQANTNYSPQGLFVTTSTRSANNKVFSSGTFVRLPNQNGPEFRGIALHESGASPFGAYLGDNGSGAKLKNGSSDYSSLVEYLRRGEGVNPYAAPGNTDGCVGIPQERIREANRLLEGGSFVYFYCK